MAFICATLANRCTSTLNEDGVSAAYPTDCGKLALASTAGFPLSGFVLIDNDIIYYSSKSGNNLVIGWGRRGYDGTVAAGDANGATVYGDIVVAKLLNDLREHGQLGAALKETTTKTSIKLEFAVAMRAPLLFGYRSLWMQASETRPPESEEDARLKLERGRIGALPATDHPALRRPVQPERSLRLEVSGGPSRRQCGVARAPGAASRALRMERESDTGRTESAKRLG